MKEMLLRSAVIIFISVFAISSYGGNKVDYARMETLVTNQLVFMSQSVMARNFLNHVRQQTGATDSDVADCLGRYIEHRVSVEPGTTEYGCCRTAIWLFAEISDDRQMNVLADIAGTYDSKAAEKALSYYYRRMRNKGGLEFIEKLLDRDELCTNMYVAVSTVLRLDAKDFWGKDVTHRAKLEAFSRRQLSRRKHCRIFDEVLSAIDAKYAVSEQRKQLAEDAVLNRIRGMGDQHRKYFLSVKETIERRKENGK